MADIDVEELLRQGGRHDDGDLSVDDLVAQGGTVDEAPGVLRTYGRLFRNGVNPLWDEGAGFMGANVDAGRHLLETGSVVSPSEWLEGYRRNRDESRDTDARGAQANPTAATAGKVTGAVVQGIASGGAGGVGRGLVSAVTSGATQGAVNALAGSEADLTRLEGENYARAAMDTLEGGGAGAVGGTVGYGVGKGLGYVGGKVRDAYRGARGTLEAEARAGLEAEEAALRAGDDAAEARRVAQEARAAAQAQRPAPSAPPAGNPASPPAGQYPRHRRFIGDPNADPSTKVLKGYEGGAHRRQVDNEPKVLFKRDRLKQPDLTPAQRADAEAYLRGHGDAIDNPPAFRLRVIEDELLRHGYSPDVVRRAMARFDAEGRAVSRGARPPEQPLLTERTQTAEPADWLKRGHDMEDLARQGGGGSALDGLSEAKTRIDARMQPDPFHDAPTRVGLIRTSPDGGITSEYVDGPMHNFEFTDPNSGEVFEVIVSQPVGQPGVLNFENIYPKAMGGHRALRPDGHAQVKNTVGPRVIRGVYDELAHAFPEARRITAYRATGANAGRNMEMRLPEVTEAMDMGDVVKRGRVDAGGGGSAFGDAFAEAPTRVGTPGLPDAVQRFDVLDGLPAVKPGAGRHWGEQRPSRLPPEDIRAAEEAMAARRAAAFGSGPGGSAPEPTAGARPRAMPPEASASMRAPEDGPLPPEVTDTGVDPRFEATQAEFTRATRVPEVRRGAMRPEATTVRPPPEATQVGGPSDFTDPTRYAPPDLAQRLAGRPSVDSLVDERIAGGGQALRRAFTRGATGEGSAALGLAGLALGGPAGSLKALALRGGLEVVREALRNPAAKARAIEAFKLQRLAAIRPEVWGRVSATLQRAAQRDEEAGTDYHARAARHALLQTDPAFRAAEAEAAKELQGLSEEELARHLAQ